MRRGQHPTTLVAAFIILALVLLLSAGLIMVIRGSTSQAERDAPCYTQIRASSVMTRFTKELGAPAITCPTKVATVTVSGEEEAKAVLASHMMRCWDTWGKGELMLFGDEEGMYCHVCSMVTVEGADTISGLPQYLDSAHATPTQTYAQYILGKRSGTYFTDEQFKSVAPPTLSTSKPVGVIFYYAKGRHWYEVLRAKTINDPGVGVGGGALIGVGVAVTAGASMPVTLVAGAAAGISGGFASFTTRPDSSYIAWVAVRPLTASGVNDLGCQYDPVSN